ncbi:Uncharacterized conserved protein, contains GH25 family domain [Fontimonas thermophila]|uniref:Uncharacterized conserved protein, contains GH25 family domain n=1 Tax=Fontimonas thermophila TaxID=1076937 RepID=A0A1I2IER1_9GAMM|nr:DUF4198 domain-containing protein [Fontimonas thermophila]SFF40110.1 Uncharacterized conserved protein, contains GH25 family domain [Fontimonas thermophila]
MNAKTICVAVLATLLLAPGVHAHKRWFEPSKTVLNVGQWVTVDAASSTDPFIRDHNALPLDNLVVTGPDGNAVTPVNLFKGRLRSSFDLELVQAGTYRIAWVNEGITAVWEENGQRRVWPPRGTPFTPEGFGREVPANADKLRVIQMLGRLETFVTAGKPNDIALKPVGRGLELQPITGFNDLYVGEPATFRLLLDGKPAVDLEVVVIADGIRYRNSVDEIRAKTDEHGRFTLDWPKPGFYWLSATVTDDRGTPPATERRVNYAAVVEVLTP